MKYNTMEYALLANKKKAYSKWQKFVKTALMKSPQQQLHFSEESYDCWIGQNRLSQYSLCCTFNCHDPCNLNKPVYKSAFLSCACIARWREYSCECGHHYTYHYHFEQCHEETIKEEEVIDKVMKEKFKEANTIEERARILNEELESDRRILKRKRR